MDNVWSLFAEEEMDVSKILNAPKIVKHRRYTPLLKPASFIGNLELHYPTAATDFGKLLSRDRKKLHAVLAMDIDFILTECLVGELLTGRDYITLKGIISEDVQRQARELITTLIYCGKEKEFLKLLATPDIQTHYKGLNQIVPPAPDAPLVTIDAETLRSLSAAPIQENDVSTPPKMQPETGSSPAADDRHDDADDDDRMERQLLTQVESSVQNDADDESSCPPPNSEDEDYFYNNYDTGRSGLTVEVPCGCGCSPRKQDDTGETIPEEMLECSQVY